MKINQLRLLALLMPWFLLLSACLNNNSGGSKLSPPSVNQPSTQLGGCQDKSDTDCKASKDCIWDASKSPTCQAAATPGQCENIQSAAICAADVNCEPVPGAVDTCRTKVLANTNTKNVLSYTLTKLGKANPMSATDYGIINDNKLKGISASLDGDYVYIVGDDTQVLLARAITNAADSWANVSADWSKITDAKDASAVISFSGKKVEDYAPLSDGLIFSVSYSGDGGILAQLKAKGNNGVGIQGWKANDQGLKNTTSPAQAMASVKKTNGDEVIYFNHTSSPNNVVYADKRLIPSGINPADGISNGAGSLVFDRTLAGTRTRYAQIVQVQSGDLLMVGPTLRQHVDLLKAASVGVSVQDLANPAHGKVAYFNSEAGGALSRVPTEDNFISQCAAVDKYILCGMSLSDAAKDGGIAVYDTTSGADIALAASWRWLADGATVAHDFISIAVDRHDLLKKNKRALIFVKTGFYIFEDGDLIDTFANPASKLINNAVDNQVSDVASYASAKSGYEPASALKALPAAAGNNQKYLGAAQDRNGLWYIAVKGHSLNDGGVFTFKIEETVVQ